MSAKKVEQEIAIAAPRETSVLFGHREAENALASVSWADAAVNG